MILAFLSHSISLFPVICFKLLITQTPDNFKLFSISLEGSSYRELTVIFNMFGINRMYPGSYVGVLIYDFEVSQKHVYILGYIYVKCYVSQTTSCAF